MSLGEEQGFKIEENDFHKIKEPASQSRSI